MSEQLELSVNLPAPPKHVYEAWMDSQDHGAFSGSAAAIDPRVGGRFTAWDEYISGETLALEPYRRILQSWRTPEFPADAPDSQLEILLEAVEGGTKLTLKHTQIPDGQGTEYEKGWTEYYFKPMLEFFAP